MAAKQSLMEVIKQTGQKPVQQAGQGSNLAQQLLGAKTGKQAQGARGSALGEQQAQAQTGQQLGAVQQAGQLKAEQQAGQAQEQQQAGDIQARGLEIRKKVDQSKADQQVSAIMQDYRNAIQQGDQDRAEASQNQAGVLSRLSNDKYLQKLDIAAREAGIQSDNDFRTSLQRDSFQDNLGILRNNQKFQSLLNVDQREFNVELAKMDAATALAIMQSQIAQQGQQQMWSGIQQGASGVIGGVAQYKANQPTQQVQPQNLNTPNTGETR